MYATLFKLREFADSTKCPYCGALFSYLPSMLCLLDPASEKEARKAPAHGTPRNPCLDARGLVEAGALPVPCVASFESPRGMFQRIPARFSA